MKTFCSRTKTQNEFREKISHLLSDGITSIDIKKEDKHIHKIKTKLKTKSMRKTTETSTVKAAKKIPNFIFIVSFFFFFCLSLYAITPLFDTPGTSQANE